MFVNGNMNSCLIIYKEFSRRYLNEMSNAENVGIYESGKHIFIGKLVHLPPEKSKKIVSQLVGPMMCPVSKRMVQDPVAGRDGYLYERSQIRTHVDCYFHEIVSSFNTQFTEIYEVVNEKNIKIGEILQGHNITRDSLIIFSESLNRYHLA